MIWVRGQNDPVTVDLKFTRHGPVLHENAARNRAYALRWVGAEPGGAGYLGSLNVLQTKNWKEFNDALPRAWYIPSHSLVYADVEGNYGYIGVAQTPVRKNWDGLLPVPGKDSKYEWAGYVPFDKLPKSLNGPAGFYNSSNNDVVPKIVPGYSTPLGYEYSAPYRYDRVHEVLSEKRKFSASDMERLQQDTLSLPARELVPLLKSATVTDVAVQEARKRLLEWNFVLDRESVPATIYEFWALKLGPLAFAPKVPEPARSSVRQYDMRRVIAWMKKPDRAFGPNAAEGRNRILAQALEEAVADLRKRFGDDMNAWKWGDIHTTDFVHPLGGTEPTKELFHVDPVRRGGDGFTVMAASSPTETSTKQTSGASFMFVMDVSNWDNSTGLSVPGNSAQPLSPHYKDLAAYWGEGKYFPLAFSRPKVEEVTAHRLWLQPVRDVSLPESAALTGDASLRGDGSVDVESLFEPVQPTLFSLQGATPNAWADFDGDGDLDLFVGFRGQMNRLYRNDNGTFVDVAAAGRSRRRQRDARRGVGRLRRRRGSRSVHRLCAYHDCPEQAVPERRRKALRRRRAADGHRRGRHVAAGIVPRLRQRRRYRPVRRVSRSAEHALPQRRRQVRRGRQAGRHRPIRARRSASPGSTWRATATSMRSWRIRTAI